MSLPTFPDKDKTPNREEVINQIISSIAMEELGLSHIINAEGEKLQYALGTIPGADKLDEPLTLENILDLNKSIHKTLDSTMMNQFFLREKLQSALTSAVTQGPAGSAATIEVGKVTSVAYGSELKITNSGTSDKAVFDFEIPEGRPGSATVAVSGIQTELQSTDKALIQNGNPILFNTTLDNTDNGISYDETTGVFTISQNGTFLINWTVSVDGAAQEHITISLNVNGNSYATVSSPSVSEQVSGTAFVIVDNAPATISLVNISGSVISLIDAEVKANMVINGILM